MFVPEIYAFDDSAQIAECIRKYPLGILISSLLDGPLMASHLPFLLDTEGENWQLRAHIAKENPHSLALIDGSEVLVIFQGPNTYISSSWYNHPNVSTWNYQAVHCYGTLKLQTDAQLWHSLQELTDSYEEQMQCPVRLKDLPKELLLDYFPLISGFVIDIHRIDAANKMSQNRNEADKQNIVAELMKCPFPGAKEIGKEVEGK